MPKEGGGRETKEKEYMIGVLLWLAIGYLLCRYCVREIRRSEHILAAVPWLVVLMWILLFSAALIFLH